jgi:hypothetical protein
MTAWLSPDQARYAVTLLRGRAADVQDRADLMAIEAGQWLDSPESLAGGVLTPEEEGERCTSVRLSVAAAARRLADAQAEYAIELRRRARQIEDAEQL